MFQHLSRRGARILTVMAAAALAVLIVAPAQATPSGTISSIVVSTSAHPPSTDLGSGDTPFSATNVGAVSATIGTLGTFGCDGATAAGTLHAGSNLDPNPYLTFTSLDITNCASPAGVDVDVHLICDVTVTADTGQTVDADWIDTAVTGLMHAGASGSPCVQARDTNTGGSLCTLGVSGDTEADLDETTQELGLSGSGLKVDGVTGLCALVSGLNGSTVTFNLDMALGLGNYPSDVINAIP